MGRLQLDSLLNSLLPTGSKAYFQPPNGLKMVYPCIVYKREGANTKFADNIPYSHTRRYQVTVIDRDPDTEIYDKVAALPQCVHDRSFAADDLNHDVFTLYF